VLRRILALALLAALAAAVSLWLFARMRPNTADVPSAGAARLPDFDGAAGWVNGGPMTPDSLRGVPVAVVLWSDTDPRGLDLLRRAGSWDDAYRRWGVRVIGVHDPEFAFAAESSVTADVARRLSLRMPIARDPRYQVARALGLEPPAVVIADPDGRIVFTAGADGAAKAERTLRDLVRATHPDTPFPHSPADRTGAENVVRVVYLGTARAAAGPLAGAAPGRPQTFTTQFRFQEEGEKEVPYPVGRWTPEAEGVTSARGGAANFIAIRTGEGRVFAVLGPGGGRAGRVWILDGDGWLAPEARGADVRADLRGATYVDVNAPRLYEIVRGGSHVLRFSPETAGIVFHSFAIARR